ncbi:MAG: 50S ribosomal protein L6 [Gammaproteobacteria bacterium]|nr:50S ribosomal protein L6 [Gammaproteobacteria bacterium]
MSRIGNAPITLPSGVEVNLNGQSITVKGAKGSLQFDINSDISVEQEDKTLKVKALNSSILANALSGTTRAIVNNMVTGVSQGFEKKLELVGVGYRAQTKGNVLNLTLGFSHPVDFTVPEGVSIETPSQTEVLVKGIDKQKVGQVAANIRAYRPPEPYKGKGVRYSDEIIVRKEAKKK